MAAARIWAHKTTPNSLNSQSHSENGLRNNTAPPSFDTGAYAVNTIQLHRALPSFAPPVPVFCALNYFAGNTCQWPATIHCPWAPTLTLWEITPFDWLPADSCTCFLRWISLPGNSCYQSPFSRPRLPHMWKYMPTTQQAYYLYTQMTSFKSLPNQQLLPPSFYEFHIRPPMSCVRHLTTYYRSTKTHNTSP